MTRNSHTAFNFQQLYATTRELKAMPGVASYLNFRQYFEQCIKLLKEGSPAEQKENTTKLLKQYVLLCESTIACGREMPGMLSKKLVDLLSADENLDYILKLENGERAMGWFCTDHAMFYILGDNTTEARNFRKLLSKWTKLDLTVMGSPSMDKVVSLLYGPACWELYGRHIDGNTDDEVAIEVCREIYHANLPLTFNSTNQVSQNNPASIPDNFYE